MTEPRRLLEDATGLDRAVLESATDDEPSPARRRRVVAALGGTSFFFFSWAAAARRLASLKVASWKVVVGVAATTGLGVGGAVLHEQSTTPPPPVVASATPRPTNAPVVAPIASSGLPAVEEIEPPAVEEVEAASPSEPSPAPSSLVLASSPPSARPLKKTAEAASELTPSIAREIALLDAARSSIARGDPRGALRSLDQYDRECRGGALSPEAAVLRIEALAAAGERDAAAARARAFLASHPSTTYDTRVRAHVSNP